MTFWGSVLIRRSVASLVFVYAISVASASANPILSIDSATVNAGETFTVNIDIASVDDLYSYDFGLAFDSTILKFLGIDEGDFFPEAPPCNEASPEPPCEYPFFSPGEETAPGSVSITSDLMTVLGQETGKNRSGTLAIATFFAISAGTSSITFTDQLFLDNNFGEISFSLMNPGSVQVNGVTSPVPDEPSGMILLVAALALGACRCFTRAL